MHGHGSGKTLFQVQRKSRMAKRMYNHYKYLIPSANNRNDEFQNGIITHEIGQISKAIPFSLHICINLGCFTKENLQSV